MCSNECDPPVKRTVVNNEYYIIIYLMHSPDGQYVAAGSSDGTVYVWETLTGKMKSKKEHA